MQQRVAKRILSTTKMSMLKRQIWTPNLITTANPIKMHEHCNLFSKFTSIPLYFQKFMSIPPYFQNFIRIPPYFQKIKSIRLIFKY